MTDASEARELPQGVGTARVETGGTVSRVVSLLQAIAGSREPISVSELAALLALPVSTTHRLVQLLRDEGMVQADPTTRRVFAGPAFLDMAEAAVGRSNLVERARPILKAIVAECNETAQLAIYLPQDGQMAFVAQAECTHELRFAIPMDRPQPLVWGSSGRVILAHLPMDAVAALLAAAASSPVTGQRPPTLNEITPVLDQIREQGFDLTHGEKLANAVGIAAPVFERGQVVGSISIPVPTVRFHDSDAPRLIQLVVDACRRLAPP